MPARYGYGETKVRNSPAPSEEWLRSYRKSSFVKGLSTSDRMDGAMAKRKKKKSKKREAMLVTGIKTGNRNK